MADNRISKRSFLKTAAAAAFMPVASAVSEGASASQRLPNVVLICADDLGPGDPIFGSARLARRTTHARIAASASVTACDSNLCTPNLSRMAQEGVRLLHHNAAAPVCSPSRAALLTGQYPVRVGVPDVLFPGDQAGITATETTIAEMLKRRGYRTKCVGKWHLGSQPQFYPTNRGFEEYYGLLCSHDMKPLQLMHNTDIIEDPADLTTLTPRYVDQAVRFIERSGGAPFFLYLAHFLPHVPLVVSRSFQGASGFGAYGDAVQEIDASVGQILAALARHGLDQDTLVIVTSDHGPWYQGSSLGLRGRKGETFEGGVRVPFIARFPGRIPGSLVSQTATSHIDILPTIAGLCGADLPGKPIDGVDIWPLLSDADADIERDVLLYFDCWHLQCARLGNWKLHVARYNCPPWTPTPTGGRLNLPLSKPELYDLEADPAERYDVADDNPAIVAKMQARITALLPTFPEQVRSAWQRTQSYKVESTLSGAYPVLKSP